MEAGALRAGEIVEGRYELERIAGRGGMGEVWRARAIPEGSAVALKVLTSRGREDPKDRFAERFTREIELLADLDHPGIVRYLGRGATEAGRPYLAMEWLEGEPLSARLARGPLSVPEGIALGRRAAEALALAHARGVVHRDVKPSNLFLEGGRAEAVKLLDFGVAHLGWTNSRMTLTGEFVGTWGYIAPEQARGSRDVDARADVFSLGCVLYRCVTGRPAFAGEGATAVLLKVLLDEPASLTDALPEAPAALADLVARMLAKDPDQRPKDGGEVAEELRAIGSAAGPRDAPAPALGTVERRLLSVLLVEDVAPPEDPDATAVATPTRGGPTTLDLLREIVEGEGGRFEVVATGAGVAWLGGGGPATELVRRAARMALGVRAALPTSRMALATGRGTVQGAVPVGEAIDRAAARAAALPRGIRIDETTAGLLDPRFEVDGEAEGFVLVSERDMDVVRTLLGRPTPTVGRVQELATLESALDGCVDEGMARAVLVTGPQGVGKSRLRWELLRRLRARAEPPEIWTGRGDPVHAGSPMRILSDAVRAACGISTGEPVESRRRRVRARVGRNVRVDEGRVTLFVGELVGTHFPDGESLALRTARQDAAVMSEQVRRAFEDLVDAECATGPLVLVLEDLQWGDAPTVDLVDRLLRNLSARSLVVYAFARPEVRELFPGLWSGRALTELRLPPLSTRAAERLVHEVLGPDVPVERTRSLVERADGNAFFLEELLREAAAGKWESLPPTAVAVVQSRIEGLGAAARRVLRAASVFGDRFWRGGIVELLGGAAAEVDECLEILTHLELIGASSRPRFLREEEHVFRNALVREAAYAMLTESDRALGHRMAGGWLETMGETDALVVAEHLERGGERARAADWYLRAARQALGRDDLAAAVQQADRGAACGAADETLGRLLLARAEAHGWRGEHAQAERSARAAMDRLPAGSADWLEASRWASVAGLRLGRTADLLAVAEIVRSAPVVPDAQPERVRALAASALYLFMLGCEEQASLQLTQAEASGAAADPAAAASIHQARSFVALHQGDPARCAEELARAIELREPLGHARNVCNLRGDLGYALCELGRYAESERTIRSVVEAASRMGLAAILAAARQNLGLGLARQGRLAEAKALQSEAAAAFHTQGEGRMEGGSRAYLADVLALEGRFDEALAQARAAVKLLETTPPLFPFTLAMLARVLLLAGQSDEARARAVEANERMAEAGAQEGEALVRLVLAQAHEVSGDRAAARKAITVARDRLLARAAKISNPAWRATFLDNVPEHVRTLALARELLGS